jgi:rubrerythrin
LNQKKFNEIIDFAIKREQEAVGFYRDIKKLISFENSIELLDNLEEMERVHVEILEGIRIKTMKNVLLPRGETLEVEKHQVKINPSKDMSYHDILTLAIQREEESLQLYNKLSSQPGDDDIRKLFLRLANEEAAHKAMLEKLFDEDM